MDKQVAEEIFSACERAISELNCIESAISKIQDPGERSAILRGLARTVGELCMSLRGPIVSQHPDLEPKAELGDPDTLLDEESLSLVSKLTAEDLHCIDDTLLAECADSWRKVARVVGGAMSILKERFEDLPDGYYAQRVIALVEAGRLESQGNLHFMRHSEIRFPLV